MQEHSRNDFDVVIAQAVAGLHEGMDAFRAAGRLGDHITSKEDAGRVMRTGVFLGGAIRAGDADRVVVRHSLAQAP